MLIIMFVLTYACFPIFLCTYCNVMLAMINKGGRWILNYILPLSETKFWVWQISLMETYWHFDPMQTYWYFGPVYSTIMLRIIFVHLCHVRFFINGNGWNITDEWIYHFFYFWWLKFEFLSFRNAFVSTLHIQERK